MYGKTLKLFSESKLTDFNETLYVASETLAHHSLYKPRHLFDLDLFYGIVKFCHLSFSMGETASNVF